MTTSGTTSFNPNRDQIINTALRRIGAIAQGETPSANMTSEASDALNALVLHYETIGIHLWTETEGTLWLQSSQYNYGLGGTVGNAVPGYSATHASLSSGFNKTTLSAAAAASASTIVVASTSGFAAGVFVGVILDDSSIFWTTESGAPSGSTLTLVAPLTGSAASGNLVFTYTTALERPLRIVGARKIGWSSQPPTQVETPMNPMLARLDYRALPNKAATGVPTQMFYDPQLVTGQVWIWPAPQNALYGVNFTFYRAIQNYTTAANTSDLPQEWIRTLCWNLAQELGPEYDVPPVRWKMIQDMAASSLADVEGWDREPESTLVGVSMDQRSGN